jgi:hypothetical protein
MNAISPWLSVRDAAEAAELFTAAFDAVVSDVLEDEEGVEERAELRTTWTASGSIAAERSAWRRREARRRLPARARPPTPGRAA